MAVFGEMSSFGRALLLQQALAHMCCSLCNEVDVLDLVMVTHYTLKVVSAMGTPRTLWSVTADNMIPYKGYVDSQIRDINVN